MTKKIKFYSEYDFGGAGSVSSLLTRAGMVETFKPSEADLIVFNGGADIGTEIYGETPVFTGIPWYQSERDKREVLLYDTYVDDPSKFFLGICRGAQLLNCLNGGSLWQHVNNHTTDHKMVDLTSGQEYAITSTHHQMMRPNLRTGKILAVASEATIKHADDANGGVITPKVTRHLAHGEDVEVVLYKDNRTLCIQGHPEYVPGSEFAKYSINLVNQLMNKAA